MSLRHNLPTGVVYSPEQRNAKELYVNIEYEVDELHRDIGIRESGKQGASSVLSSMASFWLNWTPCLPYKEDRLL